ncbi:MAG: Rrf2 family transcriptional regulator [Acidobacteria bacterium]|nr:Rrf2 family transcriptional regulator [Acidobacteriota bacterium]
MIYSKSSEYAIRAFVYLASTPPGKYAMVKQIAEESDIPSHFLAKILQQLARKGLLKSSKGPTGGFALAQPPAETTLCQIVDTVDGLNDYKRCLGGRTECNDQAPCGLHDSWKHMRSSIIEYLERTSIEAVAASLEQKRRALARASGIKE